MTVISSKSAEEYKKQNYTERMDKKGMPVSPHVMIYSFPVVALSSITVRITGVCLWLGVGGIAAHSLAGGDPALLMASIGDSPVLGPLGKLSVAFPLSYHFLGGVRHAYWDQTPEAVTNEQVEKASYAVAGGSAVLTGIAMFM
ncbi:hypothetical protein TrRE_jg10723 [Triparma retinervis]|uniref:Succinate dehydrogenase cytochrome b560 subunit, mitochondrial n=1 Tax=Triparma retinervis TaxID=2557542 RepID=A0A9W7CH19_9STRA|nr:hypothetical protein TrRE_jg10723 [Triparma retinervis]